MSGSGEWHMRLGPLRAGSATRSLHLRRTSAEEAPHPRDLGDAISHPADDRPAAGRSRREDEEAEARESDGGSHG